MSFPRALALPNLVRDPLLEENSLPGADAAGRRSDARLKAMLPCSASSGQTVEFFVNTAAPSYTIQIFRMSWYSDRAPDEFVGPSPREVCASQYRIPDPETGLSTATGRSPVSSVVGVDWRSGVYLAKLEESVGHSQSHVIFVVRDITTMVMSCSNFPSTHIKRIISGRPVRLCVGQRRRTSVGLHSGRPAVVVSFNQL